MNLFVFDIETVPDVAAGRRLYDLDGLQDREVAEIMFHKQRQASGTDFLRHHLHRVVAISVVLRSADRLKVWSLGDPDSPEDELIRRFFDGLDQLGETSDIENAGVLAGETRACGILADRGGPDRDRFFHLFESGLEVGQHDPVLATHRLDPLVTECISARHADTGAQGAAEADRLTAEFRLGLGRGQRQ